jgi:hypothetical protein
MVQTVSAEQIDHLVTEDHAPREELDELSGRGVRLHVARL